MVIAVALPRIRGYSLDYSRSSRFMLRPYRADMMIAMLHIPADELDAYALGRATEPELAGIEEHLLACADCQERLEQEQGLVNVIRAALAQWTAGDDHPCFRVRAAPEDLENDGGK